MRHGPLGEEIGPFYPIAFGLQLGHAVFKSSKNRGWIGWMYMGYAVRNEAGWLAIVLMLLWHLCIRGAKESILLPVAANRIAVSGTHVFRRCGLAGLVTQRQKNKRNYRRQPNDEITQGANVLEELVMHLRQRTKEGE